MPVHRIIKLLGGPMDGQEVKMKTASNELRFPILENCGCCFACLSYKRHRDDLFVYNDGKERVKKARCVVKTRLTRTESEELFRRKLTHFLRREGYLENDVRFDILQETFQMTEQGFRGEVEIYIHSGRILENEA